MLVPALASPSCSPDKHAGDHPLVALASDVREGDIRRIDPEVGQLHQQTQASAQYSAKATKQPAMLANAALDGPNTSHPAAAPSQVKPGIQAERGMLPG